MMMRASAMRVEDLAIEQLIAQAGIEAFDIAILPGRAWFDVGRLGAHCGNPVLDRLGDELGPIAPAEGRLGKPPRRQPGSSPGS